MVGDGANGLARTPGFSGFLIFKTVASNDGHVRNQDPLYGVKRADVVYLRHNRRTGRFSPAAVIAFHNPPFLKNIQAIVEIDMVRIAADSERQHLAVASIAVLDGLQYVRVKFRSTGMITNAA